MPDLGQLAPGVLRQLWEGTGKRPLCPYHQTLSMAQLGVLSEGELAPYLAGRYVMVGANVPGFNDFADSPVHRITPGIYMHAMALAVLAGCETMPKGMPSLPFLIQAAPVSPTAALPPPVARMA